MIDDIAATSMLMGRGASTSMRGVTSDPCLVSQSFLCEGSQII